MLVGSVFLIIYYLGKNLEEISGGVVFQTGAKLPEFYSENFQVYICSKTKLYDKHL